MGRFHGRILLNEADAESWDSDCVRNRIWQSFGDCDGYGTVTMDSVINGLFLILGAGIAGGIAIFTSWQDKKNQRVLSEQAHQHQLEIEHLRDEQNLGDSRAERLRSAYSTILYSVDVGRRFEPEIEAHGMTDESTRFAWDT